MFINCFAVPVGRDEEFLEQWEAVNRYMSAKPGYVDHQLHRSVDPSASFRFANLAHWSSVEEWRAAHDDGFRALVTGPAWADFSSVPALYEAEPVHRGGATHQDA